MIEVLEDRQELLQPTDRVDMITGLNENEEVEIKTFPADQVSSLLLNKIDIKGDYTSRVVKKRKSEDDPQDSREESSIRDIKLQFPTIQDENQSCTFIPIIY